MATKTIKIAMEKILFHLNQINKELSTQIPKVEDPTQNQRLKSAKKSMDECVVQVSIVNSQLQKK